MIKIKPIQPDPTKILILDQRNLPHKVVYFQATNEQEVVYAIKEMLVRGAPLIGITAAYGFYLGIRQKILENKKPKINWAETLKKLFDKSRPTAVNLMWATTQMKQSFEKALAQKIPNPELLKRLYQKAKEIQDDDSKRCLAMAQRALGYLEKNLPLQKYRILTHCNTGALATGGIGTALGVIRLLHQNKKIEMVFASETRPYLQGSRLTAWELKQEKIPVTLICDSAAGFLMKKKEVDVVIVGADRITAKGDVANKIGTYSLSVLAKEHKIPFLVVAPESTFDPNLISGEEIPIEERDKDEILTCNKIPIAPKVAAKNYSFDVTPKENIRAIITEKRIF